MVPPGARRLEAVWRRGIQVGWPTQGERTTRYGGPRRRTNSEQTGHMGDPGQITRSGGRLRVPDQDRKRTQNYTRPICDGGPRKKRHNCMANPGRKTELRWRTRVPKGDWMEETQERPKSFSCLAKNWVRWRTQRTATEAVWRRGG